MSEILNGMAKGAELRTVLLMGVGEWGVRRGGEWGGDVRLVEVTQLLVVTEKLKEADIGVAGSL